MQMFWWSEEKRIPPVLWSKDGPAAEVSEPVFGNSVAETAVSVANQNASVTAFIAAGYVEISPQTAKSLGLAT